MVVYVAKAQAELKEKAINNAYIMLDDGIGAHIRNGLQPLYNTLSSYKSEINKASILRDLGLDGGDLIGKLSSLIENEQNSIEKVNDYIETRIRSTFETDKNVKILVKQYQAQYREKYGKDKYIEKYGKNVNVASAVIKDEIVDELMKDAKEKLQEDQYIIGENN